MKKLFCISALALCITLIVATDVHAQRSSSMKPQHNHRHITVNPSGRIVTREIHVHRIHEINLRGIADLEYRQSRNGRTYVEVRGNENLLKYLHVSDSRGVLDIDWERNLRITGKYSITVIVTSPDMNRLSAMGTGDSRITGQLESKSVELASHGTGDIRFDRINADEVRITTRGTGDIDGNQVDVRNLNVSLSGSGDIEISRVNTMNVEITISGTGDVEIGGRARDAVFKLRGTGDLDAYGLRAENVNATLSGTGDIECYAASSLRAMVSGTGMITVGGRPTVVDIRGNRKAVRLK